MNPLCAGYFFVEGGKNAHEDVAFPIVHAVAAISEHFGVDAETLDRALELANVAAPSSAKDAQLASFLKDHPEILAGAEALREKHGNVQAALAAELANELKGEVRH